MNSEANRIILQRAGGQDILGETLRENQAIHHEALSRPGRFPQVKENLQVKEVIVGDGERRRRCLLAYHLGQAQKDQATRESTLKRMEEALAALGEQRGKAHKRDVCALLTHRSMGRSLRQQKSGAITIDRARVNAEARLDGKSLLSTSDESLSPDDVALGYKQLLEVERAFRTLKTTLELRPLSHRKDDRIRAHVLLCFLALLLVRIAERQTGSTWDQIRAVMERMHLGECASQDGRLLQRTELTSGQAHLLKTLTIPPPPKVSTVHLGS